ncbi:hypothetical protein FQ028_01815 [Escherichia coli]|nr:hypothetical protein [Escherichia coli]
MRFARLASKSASRGIRDMAELTKEWLKQTIAEYEANRDELPFGLDTNSAIELQAFKLALASLEAEQVAYIFKHPAGKLFWALTDESNKDQSDVIPVYAAPPVPVVPAALPENDDEDGQDIDYLEPSEVYSLGRTAGWNACRAAMLHGAEPVSQTYKLPVNTPCQDAPAHIWLQTAGVWPEDGELSELTWCSHNQHHDDTLYVRADLVNGNSPVTPDGWVMVPKELTPEMMRAVQIRSELGGYATSNLSGAYNMFSEFWNVAVSAAPKVDDL